MIHMSTCEESSQGDKRIFEKPDREKEKKKKKQRESSISSFRMITR